MDVNLGGNRDTVIDQLKQNRTLCTSVVNNVNIDNFQHGRHSV